jgi:hypothetical protein
MRLQYKPYFNGMNIENEAWKNKVEPNFITRINKDYAKKCAFIIPGATQKFLSMAV